MPLVDENPDIVILGFDTTLTYEKNIQSMPLYKKMAVHTTESTQIGIVQWKVVHLFQTAVPWPISRSFYRKIPRNSLEKPSKHTLDYIIKETGYKPEEIAIVGDRLYTDIAVADGSDVTSILVLSGESTLEDVEASDVKPDIILESLKDITEKL